MDTGQMISMYIPQIQYIFLIKTYFPAILPPISNKNMFTWYFLQSLVQSAAWSVESDPSDLWKYKRLRYTYYLKYLLGHQKDIIACQLFKKAVLYFFICTVHCIQSHLLFQVILSRNRHVLNNHRTRSMLFFLVTTFLHLKDSFI